MCPVLCKLKAEASECHLTSKSFIPNTEIVCVCRLSQKASTTSSNTMSTSSVKSKKVLTCGKAVNSTQYDHLRGIANRHEHPHIPEPEVAMIFRKKGSRSSEVDLNELEEKLLRLKKEVGTLCMCVCVCVCIGIQCMCVCVFVCVLY